MINVRRNRHGNWVGEGKNSHLTIYMVRDDYGTVLGDTWSWTLRVGDEQHWAKDNAYNTSIHPDPPSAAFNVEDFIESEYDQDVEVRFVR